MQYSSISLIMSSSRICKLLVLVMLMNLILPSFGKADRATALKGILNFQQLCELPDSIDHIYQSNKYTAAEVQDQLKNHICDETRNLRCVFNREKRSSKYLENDVGSCQCYDGYVDSRPTSKSIHLTYDAKAGKCLTGIRKSCGVKNEIADVRNNWRYDRKEFDTEIPCISNSKCVEKTQPLGRGFDKTLKLCECDEGYIPKKGGGCFNPQQTEFPSRLISVFCLFFISILVATVLPFVDEYHSSPIGDHVRISLTSNINLEVVSLYGKSSDEIFHPTNIDGTEKNFYQILQWLAAKSSILAMKHNIYWKYGVFVRGDDEAKANRVEEMTSNQIIRKIKQEIKGVIPDDKFCEKFMMVRSKKLKAGLTQCGALSIKTTEKKFHLTVRSPITNENELEIRNIHELQPKDFQETLRNMSLAPNFPFSVIRNDGVIKTKKVVLFPTKLTKEAVAIH